MPFKEVKSIAQNAINCTDKCRPKSHTSELGQVEFWGNYHEHRFEDPCLSIFVRIKRHGDFYLGQVRPQGEKFYLRYWTLQLSASQWEAIAKVKTIEVSDAQAGFSKAIELATAEIDEILNELRPVTPDQMSLKITVTADHDTECVRIKDDRGQELVLNKFILFQLDDMIQILKRQWPWL